MKQIIFTCHRPPEYPPAPCPVAAGTGRRAHRPGAGGPCLPGPAATAGGCGSASMKKSKPETHPRHGLPPVPQSAGG